MWYNVNIFYILFEINTILVDWKSELREMGFLIIWH